MACVLTELISDVIKLGSPLSSYGDFAQPRASGISSSSSSSGGPSKRRASNASAASQLSSTDTDDNTTATSPPASPPPSAHAAAVAAAAEAAAASPASSPAASSSSAAASAGNSCHQCKTAKDASLLLFCSSAAEKGVRKRRCRKKYCDSCLRRSYNPEVAQAVAGRAWVCPSCQGFCVCAACSRGGDCDITREGLSGGLAALASMNPVILHLLGIDEQRLAHLQAVVNSNGIGAGLLCSGDGELQPGALLAMLSSPAALHPTIDSGLGMQDLSLQQHYDTAAQLHEQRQQYGLLNPLRQTGYSARPAAPSGAAANDQAAFSEDAMQSAFADALQRSSTMSTVTSPYAASSAASSYSNTSPVSSSPRRCGAVFQPQQLAPLVLPMSATSMDSQPLVPRSHTHSQPPPHPTSSSAPLSLSTPTPSRHLSDLDAAFQQQQQQQHSSRKRSWSNSSMSDAAPAASSIGVRQRFVLPPPHLAAANGDGRRAALDWAAVKSEQQQQQHLSGDWSAEAMQQQQQQAALSHYAAETELMRSLQEAQFKVEQQHQQQLQEQQQRQSHQQQLRQTAAPQPRDVELAASYPQQQYDAMVLSAAATSHALDQFPFADTAVPLAPHGSY